MPGRPRGRDGVAARRSALELAREDARTCRRCELWRRGTQTVFGTGPVNAELMLVGEQPGDAEDLAGLPFVGPAGRVLEEALREAGLGEVRRYVTNAVKHFKWEPRGKRRIHVKPTTAERLACEHWLHQEIAAVRPRVLVALGATAAAALFGPRARVLEDRGRWIDSPLAAAVTLTVHPSSILRAPDQASRRAAMAGFVADLRVVADRLRAGGDTDRRSR